ncbi:hypothetical protein [Schlesneria sp. DSM 10557]|uniref:ATP-binding protein n=1 Tax=Schlesneria sp. DSM 10557 TaxID=3044399 RepID=UPI0035A0DF42
MDFVIAGVSFPCGVRELGDVATRHGFNPIYVDHPHNAESIKDKLEPLLLESALSENLRRRHGVYLPLLESWVTQGIALPDEAKLQFDKRAGIISRSKIALTLALVDANLSFVPRLPVHNLDDAMNAAVKCGYPVVLRSDCGYSGRGVSVVHSPGDLRCHWKSQAEAGENHDYVEMRSILGSFEDVKVVEPWLNGDEWSIDCIVGPTAVHLIRVCEKVVAIVAGRPVTLGYRIIDSEDLFEELMWIAPQWCRALYAMDAISFASFDVRRNQNGDLVPLDFGTRLGGDCIPYLVRKAEHGVNIYADALDAALSGSGRAFSRLEKGHAIVHAFAQDPGIFSGISAINHGEIVSMKPRGFIVGQAEGAQTFRKIGSILTHFRTYDEFRFACLNLAARKREDTNRTSRGRGEWSSLECNHNHSVSRDAITQSREPCVCFYNVEISKTENLSTSSRHDKSEPA